MHAIGHHFSTVLVVSDTSLKGLTDLSLALHIFHANAFNFFHSLLPC